MSTTRKAAKKSAAKKAAPKAATKKAAHKAALSKRAKKVGPKKAKAKAAPVAETHGDEHGIKSGALHAIEEMRRNKKTPAQLMSKR